LQDRATGHLYTVLALLVLANVADLYLTTRLIWAGAMEINPLLRGVLLWGDMPALVGVKCAFALAEVAVGLGLWRYLWPADRFERRVVLTGAWLSAGYMFALCLFLGLQYVLLQVNR
jgi:hypothetical protein